jgi:hypothetical protein
MARWSVEIIRKIELGVKAARQEQNVASALL